MSDGVVTLRGHREVDIEPTVVQCRDEETVRWTTIPHPYTPDDAKRFVREQAPGGWEHETDFTFVIEVDGRFAGSCSVHVEPGRRGEIGYVVHPDFRGRGVMTRAVQLLVDWAFDSGRFDTLSWVARVGNWRSRRGAWQLGFSIHGPLEQWLPQHGSLHDCWIGLLRKDDPRTPRHPWYDPPRIHGRGIALRPPAPSDGQAIIEAFADPGSRQWLRLPAEFDATAYLEERKELMASGKLLYWAVADATSDALLGAVMLFNIESGVDAELGYFTHPAARGRGVATEAGRLAVRHAFVPEDDGGLGLGRVTAYAGVDNVASARVIERIGFTRYGVERLGGGNGTGDRFDLACYDLLAGEFPAAAG